MGRVIHFELNADDPERAAKFYREVFKWKIEKWSGPQDYWLISTGEAGEPGIDGGLMRRQEPGATTVNSVEVDSIEATIEAVEKGGGKVVAPKMTIAGVGYLAYLQDTEGNVFGILQPDTSVH